MKSTKNWAWAILLPFALLASTALVFRLASQQLGDPAGYLVGFAFYWLFWCLLLPRLVFGKGGLSSLLTDQHALFSRRNWLAALLWVIVLAVSIVMYGRDFIAAPVQLILLAVPLATINGFCEEILWRGLYPRLYPNNPWLGIIYPALGFAAWHIAPNLVFPTENLPAFIASTAFLGLSYGFIAYRTGSAQWPAISHSLSGVAALSGLLASSVIRILGGEF